MIRVVAVVGLRGEGLSVRSHHSNPFGDRLSGAYLVIRIVHRRVGRQREEHPSSSKVEQRGERGEEEEADGERTGSKDDEKVGQFFRTRVHVPDDVRHHGGAVPVEEKVQGHGEALATARRQALKEGHTRAHPGFADEIPTQTSNQQANKQTESITHRSIGTST